MLLLVQCGVQLPHGGVDAVQSALTPGEEGPLGGGKAPQLGGHILHFLLVQPVLPKEGRFQFAQAGSQGTAIGAQILQTVQHGANFIQFSVQSAHSCLSNLWVYVIGLENSVEFLRKCREKERLRWFYPARGIESIIEVLSRPVNPAPVRRCPFGGGVIQ